MRWVQARQSGAKRERLSEYTRLAAFRLALRRCTDTVVPMLDTPAVRQPDPPAATHISAAARTERLVGEDDVNVGGGGTYWWLYRRIRRPL